MSQPAATVEKYCPACRETFSADSLFCPTDGTALVPPPALGSRDEKDPYLGQVIQGDIEIRQLVGIGAMGRVYRAFQAGIERHVAVKILHRELSSNPTIVGRFHREAKVASRLVHPNVVHVHLLGELPDKAMYIVMEFLDGMSLQSALLAAGGAMPITRALHIALQLADAVGEAHAEGVVHRDLKPENIMLIRRSHDADFVKVLDFGIARINWGEQSMATQQGLIFGTARYVSPEGAQGEVVGPEGDVYSIATLVYQLLSGRTPFDGDQAVGILIQQINDPPPPLRSIPRAAYVPEPIARVIMQNLSKNRTERQPNARAFGRALLDAATSSGMNVEDLLSRPSVFGPSPSQPIQLPPMQKTHEFPSPKEKTEGRTPSASGIRAHPHLPVKTTPLAKVNLPPDPKGATAKWTPTPVRVASTVIGDVSGPPGDGMYTGSASREPMYSDAALDDLPDDPRRRKLRSMAIVVVCFLVGGLASLLALYKFGWMRERTPIPAAESAAARMELPSADPVLLPLPSSSPLVASSSLPSTPGETKVALSLEFFPPKPGVADVVALVGKVAANGHARSGPGSFVISGPGQSATKVLAIEEGGSYRAGFTFGQAGKYSVVFLVKFDNFRAQTTRTLVIGHEGAPTDVAPKPNGSAKWI